MAQIYQALKKEMREFNRTARKEKLSPALTCSPKLAAVQGYFQNRQSLVDSLGKVNWEYGYNGGAKAASIREEIGRIDQIIREILETENPTDSNP